MDLLDSPIICRELPFDGVELDVHQSQVVDRPWKNVDVWAKDYIIGSPGLSFLNDRAYYTLQRARAQQGTSYWSASTSWRHKGTFAKGNRKKSLRRLFLRAWVTMTSTCTWRVASSKTRVMELMVNLMTIFLLGTWLKWREFYCITTKYSNEK